MWRTTSIEASLAKHADAVNVEETVCPTITSVVPPPTGALAPSVAIFALHPFVPIGSHGQCARGCTMCDGGRMGDGHKRDTVPDELIWLRLYLSHVGGRYAST